MWGALLSGISRTSIRLATVSLLSAILSAATLVYHITEGPRRFQSTIFLATKEDELFVQFRSRHKFCSA
jgi:hypothetical protein